jgi:hypothetical protein
MARAQASHPPSGTFAGRRDRDPLAIRRRMCAGPEPLASRDALAAHVDRYASAGIATFIYNLAVDRPVDLVRQAGPWLAELRAERG